MKRRHLAWSLQTCHSSLILFIYHNNVTTLIYQRESIYSSTGKWQLCKRHLVAPCARCEVFRRRRLPCAPTSNGCLCTHVTSCSMTRGPSLHCKNRSIQVFRVFVSNLKCGREEASVRGLCCWTRVVLPSPWDRQFLTYLGCILIVVVTTFLTCATKRGQFLFARIVAIFTSLPFERQFRDDMWI